MNIEHIKIFYQNFSTIYKKRNAYHFVKALSLTLIFFLKSEQISADCVSISSQSQCQQSYGDFYPYSLDSVWCQNNYGPGSFAAGSFEGGPYNCNWDSSCSPVCTLPPQQKLSSEKAKTNAPQQKNSQAKDKVKK